MSHKDLSLKARANQVYTWKLNCLPPRLPLTARRPQDYQVQTRISSLGKIVVAGPGWDSSTDTPTVEFYSCACSFGQDREDDFHWFRHLLLAPLTPSIKAPIHEVEAIRMVFNSRGDACVAYSLRHSKDIHIIFAREYGDDWHFEYSFIHNEYSILDISVTAIGEQFYLAASIDDLGNQTHVKLYFSRDGRSWEIVCNSIPIPDYEVSLTAYGEQLVAAGVDESGKGFNFSKSVDNGKTWSEIQIIQCPGYEDVGVPSLIEYKGLLVCVFRWTNEVKNKSYLYFIASHEGDITQWSEPKILLDYEFEAYSSPSTVSLTVTPTGDLAVSWLDDHGNHCYQLVSSNISKVVLQAGNELYVGIAEDGNSLEANRGAIRATEVFDLVELGNNLVALKTSEGKYISSKDAEIQQGLVGTVGERGDTYEVFELIRQPDNVIALKTLDGQYIGIESGKETKILANSNNLSENEKFTLIHFENEIANALEIFSDLVPQNAEKIRAYKAQLHDHIINFKVPEAYSQLTQIQNPIIFDSLSVDALDLWNELTPCEQKTVYAVLSFTMLLLSIAGLKVAINKYLDRVIPQLARDLPDITELSRIIQEIEKAYANTNALAMSRACLKLFKGAVKVTMLKDILKEVVHEMTWWDWTKSSAIAIMQITIWTGSAGNALMAELLLVAMSAEGFIEDTVEASRICFPHKNP